MKKFFFRSGLALALVLLLVANFSINIAVGAQNFYRGDLRAQPAQATTAHAKLAVIIILDQFRADYLTRFEDLFGPNGFKRLMARGAYFTSANYPYSNTFTAVGHATIVTGSIPAIHGIVGNEWYDRAAGAVRGAVADPDVNGIGAHRGSSPWRLLSTTIGDQLRMSNNYQSKSIGISIKDRAAAIIAGRRGSAAYWFEKETGTMASSSYFLSKLPDWAVKFNELHYPDQYFKKSWDRKLPLDAYKISDRDDAEYEDTWPGNSRTFPHLLDGNEEKIGAKFYDQFTGTPFSNDMLTKFAIDALAEEHLGEGKYPDLLAVSFSATDLVGHLFGPYSQEEEDMIVRLDENIAALLDAIDHQVGLNNTIIALTSDHGVAPIPEYSRQHGLGGNRINGMELAAQWETKLEDRYGEGKYILKLINHEIYLNEKLLSEKNINIVEVEEFLGREAVKTKGIAGFFTRAQLLRGELPNTDIGRRAQAAFNARESGDLHLLVEPFTLLVESKDELTGTAHGTPYPYDTHVPIILMGPGIKAGVYRASCAPNDIAPTFAALLKIEAPSGSIGRVLTEALGE